MNAYASECSLCGHLITGHRLATEGDLIAGPYICARCGCAVRQDVQVIPLTKWQYEAKYGHGGTELGR